MCVTHFRLQQRRFGTHSSITPTGPSAELTSCTSNGSVICRCSPSPSSIVGPVITQLWPHDPCKTGLHITGNITGTDVASPNGTGSHSTGVRSLATVTTGTSMRDVLTSEPIPHRLSARACAHVHRSRHPITSPAPPADVCHTAVGLPIFLATPAAPCSHVVLDRCSAPVWPPLVQCYHCAAAIELLAPIPTPIKYTHGQAIGKCRACVQSLINILVAASPKV